MRVLGYLFLLLLVFSQVAIATDTMDAMPSDLEGETVLDAQQSLALDCALNVEGSADCASPAEPEKLKRKWYYSSIKEMPMGLGVNGVFLRQNVAVDQIKVGLTSLNGGHMYDIDSLVSLPSVQPQVWGASARADIWVLPFLNLFAVGGHNWIKTPMTISLFPNGGLTIPPAEICPPVGGCREIPGAHIDTFNFDAAVYPSSNSFGVGTVLALPIKNWAWVSLDGVYLENRRDISNPTRLFNVTGRLGKNFNSLILNRQRTAFWVGVNMVNMLGSTTEKGAVAIGPILDSINLIPQETKDDINAGLDAAVAGAAPDTCPPVGTPGRPLTCAGQPAGAPDPGCGVSKICETQAQQITQIRNVVAGGQAGLHSADILYSVNKELIGQFEGYIGMEQQIYNIAVRFESSMNINRMQFLVSLQYRFN